MILSTWLVDDYLKANKDKRIGLKDYEFKICIDPETNDLNMELHSSKQHSILIEGQSVIVTWTTDDVEHQANYEIDPVDHDTVITWTLHERQRSELGGLHKAAVAQSEYYSRILERHTDITVYLLRDLAFYAGHKGTVIIVPETKHGTDATDIIKGYIYSDGSIKYETVQAWRYRRFTKTDHQLVDPAWLPLISTSMV